MSPGTTSAALISPINFDAVQMSGLDVYWIEGRPDAGDTLMRWSPGTETVVALSGSHQTGTSIYGYGGGSYAVSSTGVFFCHADGSSVAHATAGRVQTIVAASEHVYGDLHLVPSHGLLLAVRESTRYPPTSQLVAIAPTHDSAIRVLNETSGFYAAPRVSPDCRWLCWLSWERPYMPWDASTLWVAPLDNGGHLGPARPIAGDGAESIFCPQWNPSGDLYFVSDRSDWWNLYRARGQRIEPVILTDAELGVAQWELGYTTYIFLGQGRLAVLAQRGPRQQLLVGNPTDLRPVELPYTSIKPYLASNGQHIALIGANPTQPPTVAMVNPDTGGIHELTNDLYNRDPDLISWSEQFTYPTRDGHTGHGLYYPPHTAIPRPPLIVRAHPGPTANTSLRLDIAVQFFTSNGFAVADIDYRGSTGYGRAYRQQLCGRWGILDSQDCIDAANHLASTGKADLPRMVITGASAGGYTALRALMQPDQPFAAATARSAIIDPIAWRTAAPRFQVHHTDGLIGPWPQTADVYRARSVLHNAEAIRQPVLLLHGDADPIAPVESATQLATALRAIGAPYTLITFPGEGHSLHTTAMSRALHEELRHYRSVFDT